jgi:tetratricopeptide (TPR) repeat protein
MAITRHARLLVGILLAVAAGGRAAAQQPPPAPTAGHKHYAAPGQEQNQPAPSGAVAPRLQNLGAYTFPVTTRSAQAQRFINQGLNLSYAFNHAEAGRAFREAARLDPGCAMAFWGQALVLGPNINATMDRGDETPAFQAIRKAVALKANASARERAYIDALAARYTGNPDDRAAQDRAYSAAMGKVHAQFPDDLDAATLFVESVMDLRPWGYWMPDGRPYEGTAEGVRLIENVLAKKPDHPGALHLYIHLMELPSPAKAEAAADRLQPLMPAAGHIVHMPAHIYQRVGRYADAIRSNQLAIAADEDYISQCRAQGMYPMGYYPHNLHFLWFAATFDGQSKLALEAARKVASRADDATIQQVPSLATFRAVPYCALTRFARWDEMLREPEPPRTLVFLYGTWLYARGLALVATGRVSEAETALATLVGLLPDKTLDDPLYSPNAGRSILAIAPEALGGEIAAARKQYDSAVAHLERAVRLEDALVYTEPAEWHYPPRHALGALLFEAGRPAEAETVYWEDLRRNPDNGWALFGLEQALRAQNKNADADIIAGRFKKAWARADVTLTGSRYRR